MANLEQWVNDRLHDILGLSDKYVAQFMIGSARRSSGPEDFLNRLRETGTIDIDQRVSAFAQELYAKVTCWLVWAGPFVTVKWMLLLIFWAYFFSVCLCQIPQKQIVEKPARAVERQALELEKKNRTYTLLEDSDSGGEVVTQKGEKKKDNDRGRKRKHLRKKREESPSSSDEEKTKRWVKKQRGGGGLIDLKRQSVWNVFLE